MNMVSCMKKIWLYLISIIHACSALWSWWRTNISHNPQPFPFSARYQLKDQYQSNVSLHYSCSCPDKVHRCIFVTSLAWVLLAILCRRKARRHISRRIAGWGFGVAKVNSQVVHCDRFTQSLSINKSNRMGLYCEISSMLRQEIATCRHDIICTSHPRATSKNPKNRFRNISSSCRIFVQGIILLSATKHCAVTLWLLALFSQHHC